MLVHKIRKLLIQVRKRTCVYFEVGGADWFRKKILLTLQLTSFKTLTKLFAVWLTYLLSCSEVTTLKFYCGFEHLPSSLQTHFTFLIWSSELIKIDDRNKIGPYSSRFPIGLSFSFWELKKENKITPGLTGFVPSTRKLPAQPGRMGESQR